MITSSKDVLGCADNFYGLAYNESVSIEIREKAKKASLLIYDIAELLIKQSKAKLEKVLEEKENP